MPPFLPSPTRPTGGGEGRGKKERDLHQRGGEKEKRRGRLAVVVLSQKEKKRMVKGKRGGQGLRWHLLHPGQPFRARGRKKGGGPSEKGGGEETRCLSFAALSEKKKERRDRRKGKGGKKRGEEARGPTGKFSLQPLRDGLHYGRKRGRKKKGKEPQEGEVGGEGGEGVSSECGPHSPLSARRFWEKKGGKVSKKKERGKQRGEGEGEGRNVFIISPILLLPSLTLFSP